MGPALCAGPLLCPAFHRGIWNICGVATQKRRGDGEENAPTKIEKRDAIDKKEMNQCRKSWCGIGVYMLYFRCIHKTTNVIFREELG